MFGLRTLNRFFDPGMARVAQFARIQCKELRVVGSMGLMAGEASLLGSKRGVLESEPFTNVAMTCVAESISIPREQSRIFGGVRVVADKALAVLEGNMLHFTFPFDAGRIVTVEAEFASLHAHLKGLFRRGWAVAGIALRRGQGRVRTRLQKLSLDR